MSPVDQVKTKILNWFKPHENLAWNGEADALRRVYFPEFGRADFEQALRELRDELRITVSGLSATCVRITAGPYFKTANDAQTRRLIRRWARHWLDISIGIPWMGSLRQLSEALLRRYPMVRLNPMTLWQCLLMPTTDFQIRRSSSYSLDESEIVITENYSRPPAPLNILDSMRQTDEQRRRFREKIRESILKMEAPSPAVHSRGLTVGDIQAYHTLLKWLKDYFSNHFRWTGVDSWLMENAGIKDRKNFDFALAELVKDSWVCVKVLDNTPPMLLELDAHPCANYRETASEAQEKQRNAELERARRILQEPSPLGKQWEDNIKAHRAHQEGGMNFSPPELKNKIFKCRLEDLLQLLHQVDPSKHFSADAVELTGTDGPQKVVRLSIVTDDTEIPLRDIPVEQRRAEALS